MALGSDGKAIAVLGNRWWPQAAKKQGDITIIVKSFFVTMEKQRNERPNVGGVY